MRIMVLHSGHSVSTIDVSNGYVKALKKSGHQVRECNLHNWLSYYYVAQEAWSEKTGDPFTAGPIFQLASEQVLNEAVLFVPDVLLAVCGMALHISVFDGMQRLGVPVVLLLTESPYNDLAQAHRCIHPAVELVTVNDRRSLVTLPAAMIQAALDAGADAKRAKELADKPVVYLPHAFDPEVHYPIRKGEWWTDLYFFGAFWPERARMFDGLEDWLKDRLPDAVVNVSGIPPVSQWRPQGLTPNEILADQYRHSRICLNHNRTISGLDENGTEVHVIGAESLGPRAYEIAACGAFQLCDDSRPELLEIFGESVATYHTQDDLREAVLYYLERDKLRRDMARVARKKVRACTFAHRDRETLAPALQQL